MALSIVTDTVILILFVTNSCYSMQNFEKIVTIKSNYQGTGLSIVLSEKAFRVLFNNTTYIK